MTLSKARKTFFYPVAFFVLGVLLSRPLFAESLSYDKYAALPTAPKEDSLFKRSLLHFPVYPLELVRYPVAKSLVFIEKHHVPEKIQWVYDTLGKHGLTPKFNLISLARLNVGADVDFIRLFKQKEHLPDMVADAWIHESPEHSFKVGSRLGLERILDTGFRSQAYFQYENRPLERFYGIGPHSTRADGYVYKREETKVEYLLGYKPNVSYAVDFKFGYRNTHIADGRDGGAGRFNTGIFREENGVHGIHGDEMLVYQTDARWDTRDQAGNSTKGGLRRAGFGFYDGMFGSNAQFFKYDAELSQYFSLGTPRRVLGLRTYAEHNTETDGHDVPFHHMARLGGFGLHDHMSETARAYDFNRFTDRSMIVFNIEYRYNIWQYRDWKTDAVLFFDEGQVFRRYGDFKISDFQESYGLGFRTSLAGVVLLSVEAAHGDEGTNFYVKSSTPF